MPLRNLTLLIALTVSVADRSASADEEHLRVATADGADLSVKRYAITSASAQPVILLHGLATNRRLFDLEEIETESYRYVGLAAYLHGEGFDVWLPNFRGAGSGDEESRLPEGASTWTIDDHAALDLPAVVQHVGRATGRTPLLVGHSMGALSAVIYLEGARREVPGEARIVIDAELSRQRQRAIRGAVLIAPPLRMAWREDRAPDSLVWMSRTIGIFGENALPARFDLSRLSLSDGDGVFEKLVTKAIEATTGPDSPTPQEWLLRLAFGKARNRPAVQLAKIWGGVVDDCSSAALLQFADGIRSRSMRSSGDPPVDYTAGYDAIRTRVLVVAGEHDRLVDGALLEEEFVGSHEERDFIRFTDYGHADLVLGAYAPREVYPAIGAWLAMAACD